MPAFLGFVPLLQPELGWMVLGENLAAGDTLYQGVWDNTAPFTAAVYWFLDLLFGRSQFVYYLLSAILVVVQALVLNILLIRHKAYNESTYVPSLFYMLLANAFYDFYTLSPVVLCLTFLILALRNLFRLIYGAGNDETIFFLGLNIGIAALFYLPAIAILISFLFSLLIFTGTKPRQFLLLILGFLLPFAGVMLYYAWRNELNNFYWQYFQSLAILSGDNYLNLFSLIVVALVPGIFLIIGIYRYNNSYAFNNYQVRLQQSLFYYLLMGFVAIFFSPEKSAYHLMLLLPPLAFYISQYFLLIRKRLKAELYFLGFAILLIGVNNYLLAGSIPYIDIEKWTNFKELEVREREEEVLTKGKQIVILGEDLSLYRNANLATPYLDWGLAAEQLTQLNYYENLMETFKNFSAESPQVIVDDAGAIPALFRRMPLLESRYQRSRDFSHVYLLKEEGKLVVSKVIREQ